jgi:dTDP-4-amino-4,6-dideoxygalactose transaminase
MRALKASANRHGLHLIGDAAHCIEGMRDGVRPGELSDAAWFSFYATKNLTCGEGCAIAVLRRYLTAGSRAGSPRSQSMSEGSLEPAHDAVAEVFCNVEGRHLV